jgi:hemerythrin superfamily protein
MAAAAPTMDVREDPREDDMRSVADQSVAELGGRVSVLTRQKSDHVELDRLLRRLGASAPEEQLPVLLDLYRLVFPHAFAEEAVLWPLMRRVLPDGEELTLQVEQEHQEVNELVTRLEGLESGTPERQSALDRLVEVLREDVRDEEDELFPRLQERVPASRLRLLGVAWELVRRVAPTRAHPIVARRPPGNVIAALPLSILDRSRDRLDAIRLRGAGRADDALHTATAALTRAAHAIEHLPALRRGEDPSTRVNPRPGGPWLLLSLAALSVVTVSVVTVSVVTVSIVLSRRGGR